MLLFELLPVCIYLFKHCYKPAIPCYRPQYDILDMLLCLCIQYFMSSLLVLFQAITVCPIEHTNLSQQVIVKMENTKQALKHV